MIQFHRIGLRDGSDCDWVTKFVSLSNSVLTSVSLSVVSVESSLSVVSIETSDSDLSLDTLDVSIVVEDAKQKN